MSKWGNQILEIAQQNPDVRIEEPATPKRGRTVAHQQMTPTEHEEGVRLADWIRSHEAIYPQLRYMTHHEQGGKRHVAVAAKIKAEGQRDGVPDYMLYWGDGHYRGLAIELKRSDRSNHATPSQREWLVWLEAQGWLCKVCYGADEAIKLLEEYLS